MKATLLYPAQCFLGEGPLWHPGRRSYFWVDIERGELFECRTADRSVQKWHFSYNVTLVLPGRNDQLILSLDTAIARFDPGTGHLTILAQTEASEHKRCNDGCCDPLGRLWVGTMHRQQLAGEGAQYCIDEYCRVEQKVAGTTISNGIAWSPDHTRMYFIDTPTRVVQSYIYDEPTAAISFEKNCIRIPEGMGSPDGMAIDVEGMLWIAHWGGFGVHRWNPITGEHLDTIEVPVPNVSSCAFGGEQLQQLVITTAREGLSELQLEAYPRSGDVFIAEPGVKGTLAFTCCL